MDDLSDGGPAKWSGEALERAFGLGAADYIFYLMAHATRRRDAALGELLEPEGLTLSTWRVLTVLNRLGGCIMSDLAHVSAVDRTTLTRTVDQLVKRSLLERGHSPDDRRLVRLSLTAAGVALVERCAPKIRRLNERWLKGVPDEQRLAAISLLQTTVDTMVADEDVAYGVLAFRHIQRRS